MIGMQVDLNERGKTKKKKRGAFLLSLLLFFVIFTLVCSVVSYNLVMKSQQEKQNEAPIVIDKDKGIAVEIPRGASTTVIANILKENGIISFPSIFKLMSKVNGYDGMYRSGTHMVSKDLDYDKLMRVLSSNPISVKVTLPEGYTYKQIADALLKKNLIDKDKFDKAANSAKFDYKFLSGIPQREHKLEGYLFPDTYEFDLKAGEEEIVRKLLSNFNDKFKPEYYQKAKKMNMTVDQIIILASIIEREVKDPEERKIVAGVFYNRLNSKDRTMRKLQSCATIQYIYLNKDGVVKEKITEKDTKINDPYNTYENEGLPPGPICCPGNESIEAALNPVKTDYLYFAAKGDGTHQFSKTLKEHTAAMKQYGLLN